MVNIPMKSKSPVDSQTVLSLNQERIRKPLSRQDISELNSPSSVSSSTDHQTASGNSVHNHPSFSSPVHSSSVSDSSAPVKIRNSTPINSAPVSSNTQAAYSTSTFQNIAVPQLKNKVRKGQKVPLNLTGHSSHINVCLGWNTLNPDCDVDVSAFLLDDTGKVPGDDWFVFYGQKQSPDKSTSFSLSQGADREMISIDLSRLSPSVSKIVFVLTINEALEKHLNFSMIQDAWVRVLDSPSDQEIVSFQMDEYYSNVTSMMIGEIYLYHGTWKFNAVGNGVARDLAGLCELYGVQTA